MEAVVKSVRASPLKYTQVGTLKSIWMRASTYSETTSVAAAAPPPTTKWVKLTADMQQ